MKFLVLIFALFSMNVYAWYPTMSKQEFRLVASSNDGIFGDSWDIEGQLISSKILYDQLILGGMFKLGEEESALGASLSYEVNKMFYVTLNGNLNNTQNLGGEFWVHLVADPHPKVVFLPFLQVSSKKIGSAGILLYFKVSKEVFIHVGGAYEPRLDAENLPNRERHNVSFMFGASFADGISFSKVKSALEEIKETAKEEEITEEEWEKS